ncbi:MAG: N-6 DNA methylase, partial [Gemmatimonadetes bacterium]|nr:N-6 DNA methylase [Gemmatimonadota bacterium]
LWHKQNGNGRFEWRMSEWSLHVPMIRALFHQIAEPERLHRLDLVEVLDWTAEALNRVDRAAFFARFEEEHAVQYFYEPFLEAFDPALRKELGVWYTPPEVVRYMVARVDTVLREELGIADGLADSRVVVLDPCCGTGAYLVEVLRRIRETLARRGDDALLGSDLKRAAIERVFGFELLPAPFVVSHLQLGLLLREADAPLAGEERAGVYLTNALTGWVPPKDPKDQLPIAFPELETERDAAAKVKQQERVLVVIGNPPYNGYSGVAMGEERDLVNAYRRTTRAPAPQGQGLNDLYVRFFRMAERKIVEMTGRGVVCFIANYSWLDGLSFTGMRERYLEVFDRVWIDSLNGDKYRTGKLTPEGAPDPSIFSTEYNREGIQVGTAIATLVRTAPHGETDSIRFRNLWGKGKWQELEETAEQDGVSLYEEITPDVGLGYPFNPRVVGEQYLSWPLLPEVFPTWFAGITTARDNELVATDRERLIQRMERYFDPSLSNEEVRRIAPELMESVGRFAAEPVREYLLRRGFLRDNIVRYCYRPFDVRWLYWEPETKLLDEKRAEYFPHVFQGNLWIEARQRQTKPQFDRGYVVTVLADNFGSGRSSFFPLYLVPPSSPETLFDAPGDTAPRPNLSERAAAYLAELAAEPEHLFHHTIAVLHAPAYREENAGALRQDWPRVPLPQTREALLASAELGRRLAALLNPEVPVPGVT